MGEAVKRRNELYINNVDYMKLFDSYFRPLPVDVPAESGGDSTDDDTDTVISSQEGPP